MSPRDRAIRIVHAIMGGGFSVECFRQMMNDKSEPAALIRKWIDAVEQGIAEDRKAIEKAQAPS